VADALRRRDPEGAAAALDTLIDRLREGGADAPRA